MNINNEGSSGVEKFPLPLETNPNKYSILVMGKYNTETFKERLREREKSGIPGKWAICIDTNKGEIRIGDDHLSLSEDIPEEHYIAGVVIFDISNKKVTVDGDILDWRKKQGMYIRDEAVKNAITTRLTDLID